MKKSGLTLDIAGGWYVDDFLMALASTQRVYNLLLFTEIIAREPDRPYWLRRYDRLIGRWHPFELDYELDWDGARPRLWTGISRFVEEQERLQVHGIRYGSPGFLKMFGLDKTIKKTKKAVDTAIDYEDKKRRLDIERQKLELAKEKEMAALDIEQRKLEIEKQRVTLAQQRMDALKQLLDLERSFPEYDARQLASLVSEESRSLEKLASEGKLLAARLTDKSEG